MDKILKNLYTLRWTFISLIILSIHFSCAKRILTDARNNPWPTTGLKWFFFPVAKNVVTYIEFFEEQKCLVWTKQKMFQNNSKKIFFFNILELDPTRSKIVKY